MVKLIRQTEIETLSSVLLWRLFEFGKAHFAWHGRNSYSFNRIFLIREGVVAIRNWTNDQTLELRGGQGVFMPPGIDLEFDFSPDIRLYSLHFQLELLPGIDLFSGNTKCAEFELAPNELEEAEELVTHRNDWRNFFRFERFRQGILLRLTPYITFECSRHLELLPRYEKLFRYLRNEANAQTTVKELAAVAGKRYDRFSREFREEFGKTLGEFLTAELGRRAEAMLIGSDLSVKEISSKLGFGNEFYFSRFFRKWAGVSPSIFRRRAQKDLS